MRHPVAVLVPTLAFLLLLGSPFLHVRFNAPDASILPPEVPSRAAFDRLQGRVRRGRVRARSSSRSGRPVRRPTQPTWPRCIDYSRRLAADPRIARVDSLVDVDPRLTLAQYQLLYGDPNGPRDRYVATGARGHDQRRPDRVHALHAVRSEPRRGQGARRATCASRAGPLAPPAGSDRARRRRRGGRDRRRRPASAADFPRTALFIIVTTYLVLFVLLRSVVLPAKALVMNTLSIVASFGALVWIFQDGNLSAPLGFQPLGLRRDHPAGDPVLRPVRPVDGLRGLPAVADEGGLGPDRRQRRGRRARPGAERPDRHLGGAHRRRSSRARSRSPTSC